MKPFPIIILTLALLTSCEVSRYRAIHEEYSNGQLAVRNVVEEPVAQMGGTRSTHRSDGSSNVNDYQLSFRDGVTGLASVPIAREGNLTSRMNTANKETGKAYGRQVEATAKGQPAIVQPAQMEPGTTVFPQTIPAPSIPAPPAFKIK